MNREELARAALEADSAVVALVGTPPRIYCGLAQIPTDKPYLVYTLVSGESDTVIEGGRSFDRLRIQIDAYATTNAGAIALGLAAATAMESIGELIGPNPSGRDPHSNLYRSSQDFDVIEFTDYTPVPSGPSWPGLLLAFGAGG